MSDGNAIMKEEELADTEKKRLPRRIIHFASGEVMEEYSTEEEEEEEEEEDQRIDFRNVDTTQMSWITYVQFWIVRVATTTFYTCDFLGGKLANLFGLNSPKYQYAIDEYNRAQEEDSDEEDDGTYIEEIGDTNVLREKDHLQMQSMEYGTIQSQETSLDAEDKFHLDSETHKSNPSLNEK
ncbi:protein FAM177B isoform X2 [Rana temporaria]|uniref:protein FAM177B isoform X2 n=1 Tax=Rana temporaria TaxID=8407 RepID=UPI001AACE5BA|nr:protein FAM177B isoform X2 [Rana temporaria]XP_040207304.1 protein FAM177B isoform X2 [Rana temporaria]